MGSPRGYISREELKTVAKNLLLFSSPALLAFLVAFQGGMSWKAALVIAGGVLLNSAIDFLKKFLRDTR